MLESSGRPVVGTNAETCRHCGAGVDPDSERCPDCGRRLGYQALAPWIAAIGGALSITAVVAPLPLLVFMALTCVLLWRRWTSGYGDQKWEEPRRLRARLLLRDYLTAAGALVVLVACFGIGLHLANQRRATRQVRQLQVEYLKDALVTANTTGRCNSVNLLDLARAIGGAIDFVDASSATLHRGEEARREADKLDEAHRGASEEPEIPTEPERSQKPDYAGSFWLSGTLRQRYSDGLVLARGSTYFCVLDAEVPGVSDIVEGYVEHTGRKLVVELGRTGRECTVVALVDEETYHDDQEAYRHMVQAQREAHDRAVAARRVALRRRYEFRQNRAANLAALEVMCEAAFAPVVDAGIALLKDAGEVSPGRKARPTSQSRTPTAPAARTTPPTPVPAQGLPGPGGMDRCSTEGHLVVIDRPPGQETLRYRSWPQPADESTPPALELSGGAYEEGGRQICRGGSYLFKSGEYRYRVGAADCGEEYLAGFRDALRVYREDEILLEAGCAR